MERKTRVRFAPSPTGPLHMGGVRTALYNYLFAKQNGGDFIIRIEDTDSHRFVPGAEKYIIEALEWCGIHPDEGVDENGNVVETPSERHPHAPYRQSQRKGIYRKFADQLIENGYCRRTRSRSCWRQPTAGPSASRCPRTRLSRWTILSADTSR